MTDIVTIESGNVLQLGNRPYGNMPIHARLLLLVGSHESVYAGVECGTVRAENGKMYDWWLTGETDHRGPVVQIMEAV